LATTATVVLGSGYASAVKQSGSKDSRRSGKPSLAAIVAVLVYCRVLEPTAILVEAETERAWQPPREEIVSGRLLNDGRLPLLGCSRSDAKKASGLHASRNVTQSLFSTGIDILEVVYNAKPLHSALGYVPPVEFEETHNKQQQPVTAGP